jgi:hypothetical protein
VYEHFNEESVDELKMRGIIYEFMLWFGGSGHPQPNHPEALNNLIRSYILVRRQRNG